MSQHAIELSILLVNEIYGELSSYVFSSLLRSGRLSLPMLAQKAQLPMRQLKHGLAVLIQQHLVLHYTSPDDDTTYYEADWQAAYALVRSGKIIALAESSFGPAAGELVSNLLLQGHTTIGDLTKAYSAAAAAAAGSQQHQNDGTTAADVGQQEEKQQQQQQHGQTSSDPAAHLLQLHDSLRRLHREAYISPVWASQFRPYADSYNEAARRLRREGHAEGSKATKARHNFECLVRKRLREWRENGDEALGRSNPHKKASQKRPLDDAGAGPTARAKRARLNRSAQQLMMGQGLVDMSTADGEEAWLAEEDMAIRVNHERYTVLARNQRLVEMVEQIIHPTPALVFAELLKQLSPYIPRCQDPLAEADDEEGGDEANRDTVPTISTYDLAQSLRPDIDLEGALGKAPSDDTDNAGGAFSSTSKSNGKRRRADSEDSLSDPDTGRLRNGSRAKRTTNGNGNLDGGGPDDPNDDDDDDDDDNDDDGDGEHGDGDDNANDVDDADAQRVRLVEQHLRLLAQSPPGFVRRVRRGAHDEWAVDCARLVAHAQRAELEALVAARFGAVALRVMRILAQRGSRLDEKQLANAALVRARDLRATLTAMHAAGVLELQEVPRDGARQASRTLFLWFFDAGRAARRLVDGVYQAMARLLQRAAAERAGGGLRVLLAKAERTDVVGHEDEYLSAKERRALQQWRDKEERLLGQMMRLDRLIELFRDF